MTNNKRHRNKKKSKNRYSEAYKKQVVREVIRDRLPYQQAVLKYGLSDASQISLWKKQYSCELGFTFIMPMSPQEEQELNELKKHNAELMSKLKEASLKVLGLETLIELAEEELNIEIRKKSGSKQSNA